jgi:tetratricopeptide (TPR) repeat protein
MTLLGTDLQIAPSSQVLIDRVGELQNRVDHFIARFSSVGAWVAVGLTVLGLLITAFIGVGGFVGFTEFRRARRAYKDLDGLVAANKILVEQLDQRARDNELLLTAKLHELEVKIEAYQAGVNTKIEERLRFVRELVAGELCYRNSDFDGALQHFRNAHFQDPHERDASYYFARTLTYKNNIRPALQVFENLIQSDKSDVRPLRGMALALRFTDPERAIALLATAIELVGSDARLCNKLENERGLLHRDQKRYQQALACHQVASTYIRNDTITLYFISVSELLCQEKDGFNTLRRAAANVAADLAAQEIKPIWAAVILWSLAFVEDNIPVADTQWGVLTSLLTNRYVTDTVMAHARALSEACKRPLPSLNDQ